MNITCESCGARFVMPHGRGRMPRFCSGACRQRAYRARSRAHVRQSVVVFPEDMTSAPRWVRADGKRPVMADGSPASSTVPSTWAEFGAVQDGAGDGFGIMLGGGLGCFDLDNAVEGGRLKPWARDVLEDVTLPVVFVETSVSDRGLHVFVLAEEGPGSRRPVGDGSVEFYSRARFIRTTGEVFE